MKAKTNLNAFAVGESAAREQSTENPFTPGSPEHRNFELGHAHATDNMKAKGKFGLRRPAAPSET